VIDAHGHELCLTLPDEPLWFRRICAARASKSQSAGECCEVHTDRANRVALTIPGHGGQPWCVSVIPPSESPRCCQEFSNCRLRGAFLSAFARRTGDRPHTPQTRPGNASRYESPPQVAESGRRASSSSHFLRRRIRRLPLQVPPKDFQRLSFDAGISFVCASLRGGAVLRRMHPNFKATL
jgi:hypothetical protein